MQSKEKINLNQSLDFTDTFNLSIRFIRQNFFHLFKTLLFIAGPFILMSSVASGYYQKSVFSPAYFRLGMVTPIWVQYIIVLITSVLSSLALIGATFEYMILYKEKGPGNFEVNDVGKAILKDTWNILWTFFGLFLLSLLIFFVGFLIYYAFLKISPVLFGIMIFFLLIAAFITLPQLVYLFSSIYFIRLKNHLSLSASISKAFYIMKGNFWWTWVVFICVGIALYLIYLCFFVPQIVLSVIVMLSAIRGEVSDQYGTLLMVLTTFSMFFGRLMTFFILFIITAVHYFSLEEKKEGKGLFERIDEIGTRKDNSVEGNY
jgi:hypothetical protein